jgi:Zn-dependent peptidase ImmA (M78 family)
MATLTEQEKRRAKRAARDVLNETFGDIELVEFPLDLNAVLERYALSLKKGPFSDKNISGAFSRADNSIYISDQDGPERQSFTVAHEIGHYKLHEDRGTEILLRTQVWQFLGQDRIESEANWFAANLLMPEEAVQRMWKVTKDISKLAAIFGVSKTAMSFRLKDLGLAHK